MGKSSITTDLAARATRGDLPGDLHGQPAGVLICSAEDNPQTTIGPRLTAAGADLSKVGYTQMKRDGFQTDLVLPDNLEPLAQALKDVGAKLLIIDPLVSHLPGKLNSWRDQDIRTALAPLNHVAVDLNLAVVSIAHFNKSQTENLLHRVSGSVGIVAVHRSVLVAARDPLDDQVAVLVHLKNNLGDKAPNLALPD